MVRGSAPSLFQLDASMWKEFENDTQLSRDQETPRQDASNLLLASTWSIDRRSFTLMRMSRKLRAFLAVGHVHLTGQFDNPLATDLPHVFSYSCLSRVFLSGIHSLS